ncbi:pentatricopeptide repeat-containing protein At2g19280-like [Musa acuminata AAA Group]|uniref:pentatricopeptide repeat-containing protein At2g19280-like n=1 Tax=Musa acuminata AAA Group TaxID=214697 RepID=UPI0031E218B7
MPCSLWRRSVQSSLALCHFDSIPISPGLPLLHRRHWALPCESLLSDSESSSAPEDCCSHHYHYPRTTERISYRPCRLAASRRRYYLSRQWFCRADMMKRMRANLSHRGWILGSPNSLEVELCERNVVALLNDLFEGSSDAALAFYFFRLSQWYNGSKHGVRAVSTMVHIAVTGNMNHIAVKLLRIIARNVDEHSDGVQHQLVFGVLRETCTNRRVLETVYSMLVMCYVDKGMVKMAIRLVDDMRNLGMYPTIRVYNSLIKLLLESKQYEVAWQVFVEMPSSSFGSNQCIVRIVSLFIRELGAHGDFDCACKLLFEIQKYGGQADVVVYTTMINALCKWGLLKEAAALLYKMLQLGISHDDVLVSSVVNGYCKAGRLVDAAHLLNSLSGIPDVFVYNSFILMLCKNGNMVEAYELFKQMFEVGLDPDSFNYTAIIDGYCRACELDQALKTFALMLKRGVEPTCMTYTVLIESYCDRNDLCGAEYMLSVMKMEGVQPDVVTYNTLINGYSKKGHMHRAYELKDVMEKDGVSTDVVTYNILMHGLIKRGYVKESREVFNELVRRGFSPDRITFTNVIDSYSQDGNLEEAFLIWCSMSNNGITPDVVTCSALLNCFCKRQRMQDASVLFHKMLDAGLEPDLILYNTLICGFCKEGNISEACRFMFMMNENDIFPNNLTYEALVCCFEKIGVKNAAENAAMKMQEIFFEKYND